MTKWHLSKEARLGEHLEANVIHYINKLKKENNMIITIDAQKIICENITSICD